MGSVKLNTVETCLFCQNNRLLELLFCLFDVLQCHFFGNWVVLSYTSDLLSNSYRRGCYRLASVYSRVTYSTSVKQLDKDFSVFCVDCLDDFFPSFHLLFVVEASCTVITSTNGAPSCGFSEDKSYTCPLRIVFCNKVSGYTVLAASTPSHRGHDSSIA